MASNSNSNSNWVYDDFSGTDTSNNTDTSISNNTDTSNSNNTDTSNSNSISNNTEPKEWTSYPLGAGYNVFWSLPESSSFADNGYILPDPQPPSRNNKYIEPTRRFNQYEGCLRTDNTNGVYYLNIMDVFAHVTLGSSIADEYYDYINDYICNAVFGYNVDQLDNKLKITTTKLSFNGRSYERTVVLYHWKHYGIIASSILQWAVCNPEKIAGF